MIKLVIVTLAVTIATIQVNLTRTAAATQMRSSAISSGTIARSSNYLRSHRYWLAGSKCTIKRYRRPRVREYTDPPTS